MPTELHIQGLVRACRNLRNTIQAGVSPAMRRPLYEKVRALVNEVNDFCASQGTSPMHLPRPSRETYVFLATTDPATWPVPPQKAAAKKDTPLRLPKLLQIWRELNDKMWRFATLSDRPSPVIIALQRTIVRAVYETNLQERAQQLEMAALTPASRAVLIALRRLTEPAAFQAMIAANCLLRQIITDQGLNPNHVSFSFALMRSLWASKRRFEHLRLRANIGYLHAPRPVWEAILGAAIQRPDPTQRERYTRYSQEETYRTCQARFTLDAALLHLPQGACHDLEASFQRVNLRYFDGQVERPHLAWGSRTTTKKFGHFDFTRNQIVVSPCLDAPEVPLAVLDFVVFHELLHKIHGLTRHNGRNRAHTPAFRKDERRFATYAEAEAWLSRFAQQH